MWFEIVTHAANVITNIVMCFVWIKMLESRIKLMYSCFILLILTAVQELYVIFIGRNDLLSVISLIFYISYIFLLFKNPIIEKIIVFSFSYFAIAITDIMLTVFIKLLAIDSVFELLMSFAFFYYPFFLLICRNLWSIRDILFDTKISIRIISVLFLLPSHILFTIIAFTSILRNNRTYILYSEMLDGLANYNNISFILILISCILFVILYSFIMSAVKKEIYNYQIKISLTNLQQKNEEELKYYSEIQNSYNKAREYRHDLNNIVSIINILEENNVTDKEKIILQLEGAINQLSVKQEINNAV